MHHEEVLLMELALSSAASQPAGYDYRYCIAWHCTPLDTCTLETAAGGGVCTLLYQHYYFSARRWWWGGGIHIGVLWVSLYDVE